MTVKGRSTVTDIKAHLVTVTTQTLEECANSGEKMAYDPRSYDDWLTDQDRWYGPSENEVINWNEANEYRNEGECIPDDYEMIDEEEREHPECI